MLEKGRILPGKILVRPIKEEEKTASGLIYKPVDVVKKKSFAGEVVLVGQDLPNFPMVVKIGDTILHSPNAFATVEIDNEDFRLLNQGDVLFMW